ncbi:MAG: nicotinate-nucleotide adenylyltransferase [Candidatus Latescibacteria bacterium]|nr:nicotinate-nucleotide adenylyltransferase [Candidatus Latescibacterota bacterium]
MIKIGLFGGTFDPVHIGHLIIAQEIYELCNLDKIIFIPSARPPHKSSDMMFTARERFQMLSSVIENNPCFEISDIEMKRQGFSYTIDTILEMKSILPVDTEFYFIVGKDNLFEINTWKNPLDIFDHCTVIVADRPYCDKKKIPDEYLDKIRIVNVPLIDVSSSEIRRKIRAKKSIRYIVPEPALITIRDKFAI